MKLKHKIILLATLPLLILGTALYIIASDRISQDIYEEAYEGMHATTLAVRDIFEAGLQGEYQVKEDGKLWKGDALNISDSLEIVDQIKQNTGMEVTVFFGSTRYLTSIVDEQGKRAVGTKASGAVVDTVLNKGEAYEDNNVIIANERYLSYYIPLYQEKTKTPVGMIFLGTKYDVIQERIGEAKKELFMMTIIILLLTMAVATVIVIEITKALAKGIASVQTIGQGKLGCPIDKKVLARRDDIGDMCRSIADLDQKLRNTILDIQEESEHLLQSSEELSQSATSVVASVNQVDEAAQNIASATDAQARDTARAGENVIVMGEMMEKTAGEVSQMENTAKMMSDSSQKAKITLAQLNDSMARVKEAVALIYTQTNETHKSVEHISEVTQLITAIASQTNLLSLNASIEAARAGEHGRGFAVVASEIQQLSEQSNHSAKEIQEVLAALTQNSDKTVTIMSEVKDIIEQQEQKINETNMVFQDVEEGIDQSIEGIHSITKESSVLEEARCSMTAAVQNVAAIAEENAASIEETAAAMEQVNVLVEGVSDSADSLSKVAERLKMRVDIFEII